RDPLRGRPAAHAACRRSADGGREGSHHAQSARQSAGHDRTRPRRGKYLRRSTGERTAEVEMTGLELQNLGLGLVSGARMISRALNAMTVHVEEYFTVQALDAVVPRDKWPAQALRADEQTRRLLDLFDAHGIKATFFVLGWVAERHQSLVK